MLLLEKEELMDGTVALKDLHVELLGEVRASLLSQFLCHVPPWTETSFHFSFDIYLFISDQRVGPACGGCGAGHFEKRCLMLSSRLTCAPASPTPPTFVFLAPLPPFDFLEVLGSAAIGCSLV